MIPENKEKNLSILVDVLKNEISLLTAYNHRKDIAVWSAVVLYFTGLFVALNIFSESTIDRWSWQHILVLIFLVLIVLVCYFFIKSQYSRIQSNITLINVFHRIIFDSIRKNEIDIDLEYEQGVQKRWPKSIMGYCRLEREHRPDLVKGRWFFIKLPWKFVITRFSKKKSEKPYLEAYSEQEAAIIILFYLLNLIAFVIVIFHKC